jgi:hypothetical protein
MAGLTDDNAIETLLRTVLKRIDIGEKQPDPATNTHDISRADIHAIQMSAESAITARLSRFYAQPMSLRGERTRILLKEIATKLVGYSVWSALQPTATIEEVPAAVRQWKIEADALLDQIVPLGKTAPVAGRDILLDGEALVIGAGQQTDLAVSFTTTFPFGGSAS